MRLEVEEQHQPGNGGNDRREGSLHILATLRVCLCDLTNG